VTTRSEVDRLALTLRTLPVAVRRAIDRRTCGETLGLDRLDGGRRGRIGVRERFEDPRLILD